MLSSMLDQQKISLGRVRQAYRLTSNEVETVIQAMWPHAVFPAELWRRGHEAYWKDFADSNQTVYNIENPALPQPCLSDKQFHTYLFGCEIMEFLKSFRGISMPMLWNWDSSISWKKRMMKLKTYFLKRGRFCSIP